MKKLVMLGTLVFVSSLCSAQTKPTTTTAAPKQYRLTFTLSYPNGQPSQIYSVDVAVPAGQTGIANILAASGSTANPEVMERQTIYCNDVHESPTGIAASVAIATDKVRPPLPGMTEPLHQHIEFNKKFDVALDKPTRISEPLHYMTLNKGVATEAPMPADDATPQITVTASAI